ncbi:type II toxin-antitoxin system toxin TscT [Staphylococcus epidermidis]|uniref:type II toxin-antitoxin system toxin TscT n=1 Tax=Staphylococcus epidermidis TaxID=1282 RepID=UPI0034D60C6E
MNWEIRNLMCDIEVVKEKLEDVATTHTWFVDERFTKRSLKTKEEVVNYGLAYSEHRIHNEQVTELMLSYLKELDGLMNKYKEIEKASSDVSLATESDNA